MNNVLPLLDMESDKWRLPSSADLADFTFSFDFLPNEWFKQTVKNITKDSITIGKLKLSTLHRYNYQLATFFKYVSDHNIVLKTFEDITFSIVEGFTFYLLDNVKKPQTRAVALASLKHHIKHGQIMEWVGFPKFEVFDNTEQRTLQTEDVLKSMLIDDDVMEQVDNSLHTMRESLEPTLQSLDDIVLWALITVIRHTGIRLTEALNLNENCLRKDLLKKYLLEVVSTKNETERFIPVRKEVAVAIKMLIKVTEELRSTHKTDKIFLTKNRGRVLQQYDARRWLKNKFIKRFNIKKRNGQLAELTYHQFRHQVGTELLNNGFSSFEVMQYLGHQSMHSTRLYAKVRNDNLTEEYKKVGFIGLIKRRVDDIVDEQGNKPDKEKRLMAQLPDGVCAKPIEKNVVNCKKPNACLFCPKFITTPEFMAVHKDHLERIRADKQRYMAEDLFGNDYLLFETEKALEEIVSQLEALQEGVAT